MLRHFKFANLGNQSVAILVPTKDFNKEAVIRNYIEPLEARGLNREEILVLNLGHTPNGKYPIRDVVLPWIDNMGRALERLHIKYVMVCEPTYYKKLTGLSKAEPHYGYMRPTTIGNILATICPNYTSLFYNPSNRDKIDLAMTALCREIQGMPNMFEQNLTSQCYFPESVSDIHRALNRLLEYPELACDIETYSLKLDKAGIASIAFAWSTSEGVTFHVGNNQSIRQHLKYFFDNYKGKLIMHGGTFDCKVLIYELYMHHPRDYRGMLDGLHKLFHDLHDTKIISYLALNSTADVSYKLKDLAFQFAGNWALDEDEIENVALVDPDKLLEYNMIDALATRWVAEKHWPEVWKTQNSVYEDIFRPMLKVITQMELCGMPMNFGKVLAVEEELDDIRRIHEKALQSHPIVVEWEDRFRTRLAEKATAKLKRTVKTKEDFLHESFNPGSHPQLSDLLYDFLGLPVLDTTDKGNPATGGKTLKALSRRIKEEAIDNGKQIEDLLHHLREWGEVTKILNTFIPAFKDNIIHKDGWYYLHGGFNPGGTKSGRLSSSRPNLQNLPSTGTKYAKAIKECFMAPPYSNSGDPFGWLMVGADFSSLEDRISALQTKDPNKLKIYTDGYDGHCLRAYSYFADEMPDIDPNSVASINSIEDKYPDLRQDSKSPTFLLTYMGTWKGLVKTFGFTQEKAQQVAESYHEMYKVSDEWVMNQIRQAQKDGYVTLAFGLRLRTPILPQVILENETTLPFQAHKEIKTAGNALGQSYGLLNTRAANEFMERVWASDYAEDVLPICQIHDSLYFMIRNTLGCLEWVNKNLIECMCWNELPEIQHPTVKLEAKLELYHPNWSHKVSLKNGLTAEEIRATIRQNYHPGSAG